MVKHINVLWLVIIFLVLCIIYLTFNAKPKTITIDNNKQIDSLITVNIDLKDSLSNISSKIDTIVKYKKEIVIKYYEKYIFINDADVYKLDSIIQSSISNKQ